VYASQHGLALLGYYHAEARLEASDMHPVGKRIAERIAARQPLAAALLVDNAKLAAFSRQGANEPPFALLLREGAAGKWRTAPAAATAAGGDGGSSGSSLCISTPGSSWEALRLRFLNAHAKGLHGRLADFDEHLDDVSRDYTNAGLLAAPSTLQLTR
jgi:hypothetical protein